MEQKSRRLDSITRSITGKAVIIGGLIIILLIPQFMIEDLIYERKERSNETIETINDKWSKSQTLCAPIIGIPYSISKTNSDNTTTTTNHTLFITPEELKVDAELFPEERYYGIYKTTVYKSDIHISGHFGVIDQSPLANCTVHWDKVFIRLGFSDLRGVTNNIALTIGDNSYMAETGSSHSGMGSQELIVPISRQSDIPTEATRSFDCQISLNGSTGIHFVPIGHTTEVKVSGNWQSPSFTGTFTPDHTIDNDRFTASWKVLQFNRNIPETWVDYQQVSYSSDRKSLHIATALGVENTKNDLDTNTFGVNLIQTVNHYQLNMRTAKYGVLFVVLTFVMFFFVELLTKRRIHPIQYLLVGLAIVLFYSLLLSLSEYIGFACAYLTAAIAIVALITLYGHSIFKNLKQTGVLAAMLTLLYLFLYAILQLEDMALLIGSIGLFVILAIIMYSSRKISWYKQNEEE